MPTPEIDAALTAGRSAAWDALPNVIDHAARDAARALIVRDLISTETFVSLYGPWAKVIEGQEAKV